MTRRFGRGHLHGTRRFARRPGRSENRDEDTDGRQGGDKSEGMPEAET
jgi:hypothetical protein